MLDLLSVRRSESIKQWSMNQTKTGKQNRKKKNAFVGEKKTGNGETMGF